MIVGAGCGTGGTADDPDVIDVGAVIFGPRERIPCLRVDICFQSRLGSARTEKSGWMGVNSLTVSCDTSYDLVGDVGGDAVDGADDVEDECEEERVVEDASATASDAAGDTDDAEVSHDAVR